MIGETVGPYRVLRKLGEGGMGEVYLAEDVRLGRKLALKVVSARLSQDQDRLLRFQWEARSVSALNHPNVITIYDIGEADGRHYFATEFVDGETLRAPAPGADNGSGPYRCGNRSPPREGSHRRSSDSTATAMGSSRACPSSAARGPHVSERT